jgi:predicted dehydrogenase
MSNKIRVGVVGTSWYSDNMHLPILKGHAKADLVAVCGRRRERAQEMADKYDIPQVFTSYEEMIQESGIEALVVATPDDLHYPITMMGLDAGLHVLCEKPLALSVKQAQTMLDKAEAMEIKHMTYFTWRWCPAFHYVHNLIQDGYIGRCYYSQFRYESGGRTNLDYNWHWDPERSLGVLGNLGVHMIDMARWYFGDIEAVNAQLHSYVQRLDQEGKPFTSANDDALLTMKYKESGQGVLHVSAVAYQGDRSQQFQFILYGEEGTLEVDCNFKDGYVVRGARKDEDQIRRMSIPDDIMRGVEQNLPLLQQMGGLFAHQSIGTRLFIDAIVNDLELTPSFKDGLEAQKVMEAAFRSDRQEEWVAVS